MISALTCLMLPFLGNCPAFVRDVPAIRSLLKDRAHYAGRTISVTGRVRDLDRWHSESGAGEEAFAVCDDGCIRVFMYADSPIHNGELVTVTGSYYRAYRIARHTYYNEIEATQLVPRE